MTFLINFFQSKPSSPRRKEYEREREQDPRSDH